MGEELYWHMVVWGTLAFQDVCGEAVSPCLALDRGQEKENDGFLVQMLHEHTMPGAQQVQEA